MCVFVCVPNQMAIKVGGVVAAVVVVVVVVVFVVIVALTNVPVYGCKKHLCLLSICSGWPLDKKWPAGITDRLKAHQPLQTIRKLFSSSSSSSSSVERQRKQIRRVHGTRKKLIYEQSEERIHKDSRHNFA